MTTSATNQQQSDNINPGVAVSATVLAFAVIIGQIAYNGWIFSILWNWFIPKIFLGLPSLSLGHAVAIVLIVAAAQPARTRVRGDQPNGKRRYFDMLVMPLLRGILLLCIGFILQLMLF